MSIYFQKIFLSFPSMKGSDFCYVHRFTILKCVIFLLIVSIIRSSHWFLVIICYPRMVADDAEKEMNQRSHEATCLDTTQVCQSLLCVSSSHGTEAL